MKRDPRILLVTPEISYFPQGMGGGTEYSGARAGGLADVCAELVNCLFRRGADVHVAIPHYRSLFGDRGAGAFERGLRTLRREMPDERIHMAADRAFYYLHHVYSDSHYEKLKVALAFQREVINNIIPRVDPDLIHCNDWTTGLIPAAAGRLGVPCLFTVHNIHTEKCLMADIEDRGIDTAEIWQRLYFERLPLSYEESRAANPVDLLASGVFAAHFVNTVSPSFLLEAVRGRHGFVPEPLRLELANKVAAGCSTGILNAPAASYHPARDRCLIRQYDSRDHSAGKRANKAALQGLLGLIADGRAPLFFWPSRLDPVQKGCQLLADGLYALVSRHWDRRLQVVIVADGPFKRHFRDIVDFHGFGDRVAVRDFDERLARLAYAAADFVLMPSLFEPCGLPQMIGPIYGSLPVAHRTGGIRDTVRHLSGDGRTGNGFLFEIFDTGGLLWAIEQALDFHGLPEAARDRIRTRIMAESAAGFNHDATAAQYISLYEKMLQRPLLEGSGARLPIPSIGQAGLPVRRGLLLRSG